MAATGLEAIVVAGGTRRVLKRSSKATRVRNHRRGGVLRSRESRHLVAGRLRGECCLLRELQWEVSETGRAAAPAFNASGTVQMAYH